MTDQRIGIATPGGKYHLAYGNPPQAICHYGWSLGGQTEIRDTRTMPRDALCARCFPDPSACTDACVCRCDSCVIFGAHIGQGHDDPRGRYADRMAQHTGLPEPVHTFAADPANEFDQPGCDRGVHQMVPETRRCQFCDLDLTMTDEQRAAFRATLGGTK